MRLYVLEHPKLAFFNAFFFNTSFCNTLPAGQGAGQKVAGRKRAVTAWLVAVALCLTLPASALADEPFHDVAVALDKLNRQKVRNGIQVPSRDLAAIQQGVVSGQLTKRDVRDRLGRPNGHEPAQRGDAWFYVINLADRAGNNATLDCQYRINFADQRLVSARWRRPQCRQLATRLMDTAQTPSTPPDMAADIRFDFDQDHLTGTARASLDQAVRQARRQFGDPGFEVVGHSDSLGSFDHNLGLSQRRAERVYRFLVNQGISPSRIFVSAQGETQPVVDCTGRSGNAAIRCHAPNRRVDLRAAP